MKLSNKFFLIAGVPKSGTSWLWHNLKRYREIWFTPKKELFYFDRDYKYPSSSFFAESNYLKRIFGKTESSYQTRREIRKLTKWGLNIEKNPKKFLYYMYYILGSGSERWYKSLFFGGRNYEFIGESTATYCLLNKSDIRNISKIFPKFKAIIILRNPIERTWSNLKYDHMKNRKVNMNDHKSVRKYLNSDLMLSVNNYPLIIRTWKNAIGSDRIRFYLFDEIINNKSNLLKKIINFLGEGEITYRQKSLIEESRNKSFKSDIPANVKKILYEKNEKNIKIMANQLGFNVGHWLDR